MNEMLEKLGQNAKDAETVLRYLSTNDKNKTLEAAAAALVEHTEEILKANALDVENGRKNQKERTDHREHNELPHKLRKRRYGPKKT